MNSDQAAKLRIAVVAISSWFLYKFRLKLLLALRDAGHDVVAVAPDGPYAQRIKDAGIQYRHVALSRTGINPFTELYSVLSLRRVFRSEGIDTVLSFTPKGNIYAAFAAGRLPIRIIQTISGLGRVFVRESLLRRVVTTLYRRAFVRAYRILFENRDDRQFFVDRGYVDAGKAERIPGLGVDLVTFKPAANPSLTKGDGLVFLLIARLIWEKGLAQYADAARAIRARHPAMRFQILGQLESNSVSALPKETLDEWVKSGAIEYLGVADDVRTHVEAADCMVLPTYYREGVPRSLMEAAAMGKPIITTNISGCSDTVTDGVTGFLCRPQDLDDLVAALERFIALSPAERVEMGQRGRAKMEAEFDEAFVIGRYLSLVSRAPA